MKTWTSKIIICKTKEDVQVLYTMAGYYEKGAEGREGIGRERIEREEEWKSIL